jgi:hypothetical protein
MLFDPEGRPPSRGYTAQANPRSITVKRVHRPGDGGASRLKVLLWRERRCERLPHGGVPASGHCPGARASAFPECGHAASADPDERKGDHPLARIGGQPTRATIAVARPNEPLRALPGHSRRLDHFVVHVPACVGFAERGHANARKRTNYVSVAGELWSS